MDTRTISNDATTHEERLRQYLFVEVHQQGGDPTQILELLEGIVAEKAWEELGIGFEELIREPYPKGVGMDPESFGTLVFGLRHKDERSHRTLKEVPPEGWTEVERRMHRLRGEVKDLLAPALGEHRCPTKEEQQSKRYDTNNNGRGTSATYILRRLKRDRPDLAQKVIDGELSANAAAIEAGFRKKTFVVPEDVPGLALALVKKGVDRDELYTAMGEAMGIEEPPKQASKPSDSPPSRSSLPR